MRSERGLGNTGLSNTKAPRGGHTSHIHRRTMATTVGKYKHTVVLPCWSCGKQKTCNTLNFICKHCIKDIVEQGCDNLNIFLNERRDYFIYLFYTDRLTFRIVIHMIWAKMIKQMGRSDRVATTNVYEKVYGILFPSCSQIRKIQDENHISKYIM